MDFKIIVTIVAVLISLGLLLLAGAKFGTREKGLAEIIESARNGQQDYIRLSMGARTNLCEYVGGEQGCDSELGVEPYCYLEKDTDYIVLASPTDAGVCLLVREVLE